MANLKEIRNRITSVASTMQITSAMKMVSAAKLKRAQDAVIANASLCQKSCNEILRKPFCFAGYYLKMNMRLKTVKYGKRAAGSYEFKPRFVRWISTTT